MLNATFLSDPSSRATRYSSSSSSTLPRHKGFSDGVQSQSIVRSRTECFPYSSSTSSDYNPIVGGDTMQAGAEVNANKANRANNQEQRQTENGKSNHHQNSKQVFGQETGGNLGADDTFQDDSYHGQDLDEANDGNQYDGYNQHDDEDDEDDDEDDDDEDDDEDEDDGSSPIPTPDADEEEDEDDDQDSPFKFLQNFDPALFSADFNAPLPSGHGPENQTQVANMPSASTNPGMVSPASDPQFYSNMIQMLTHLLGSSDLGLWQNSAAAASTHLDASPLPFHQTSHTPSVVASPVATVSTPQPQISKNKPLNAKLDGNEKQNHLSSLPDLQPLINALMSRLVGDHLSPRHPVGEQDLTALLQSLMEQQQRQQHRLQGKGQEHVQQQQQHQQQQPTVSLRQHTACSNQGARSPSVTGYPTMQYHFGSGPNQHPYQPINFADIVFEDEDEDDPDFNPNLNPGLPLPSAWSLAVRDIVQSEESKAAAAAAAVAATGYTRSAQALSHLDPKSAPLQASQQPNELGISDNLFRPSTSGQTFSRKELLPSTNVTQVSPSGRPIRSSRLLYSSPSIAMADDTSQVETANQLTIRRERSRSHANAPIDSSDGGYNHQQRKDSEAPVGMSTDHSETETETMQAAEPKKKRGRKAIYSEDEARRRRLERNAEYARTKRKKQKEERQGHNTTKSDPPIRAETPLPSVTSEEVLELKIENRMLREEIERLRDENARLRVLKEVGEMERFKSQKRRTGTAEEGEDRPPPRVSKRRALASR